VLRLSKLTDYAVVVLVRLSRADEVQTSPGIAAATGIPEPTVAKVLKALGAIAVSDVIAAIDGPIALTACVDSSGQCEVERICSVRGRWNPVNDAIQQALSAITLADMRGAAQPWPYRAAAPAPLPAAE
jgi:DNA-binding IscR family transcriptional regulator